MNILAELCGDMKFIVQYRKKHIRLSRLDASGASFRELYLTATCEWDHASP
jgi:hypothetical protein